MHSTVAPAPTPLRITQHAVVDSSGMEEATTHHPTPQQRYPPRPCPRVCTLPDLELPAYLRPANQRLPVVASRMEESMVQLKSRPRE